MSDLFNIPNKNPFKTPKGYFDDFSRDLETRIAEDAIREKCGSDLPFRLPEGYFEQFSEKLNNTIVSNTNRSGRIIRFAAPYAAAAAILLLMFIAWNGLLRNRLPNHEKAQQAESIIEETEENIRTEQDSLSEAAEFSEYIISEMAIDMELADLAEAFPDTTSDTVEEVVDTPGEELDAAMEEYLLQHADYDDIIAEL